MSRTPRLLSLFCLFLVLSSLPAYCDAEPVLVPITGQFHAESGVPDYSLSTPKQHSNVLKGPERLALAGLLLMPLDHSLSESMASNGNDGVTKAANSLGTAQILVPALAASYFLGKKSDKDTAEMAVSALASAGIMAQGMKYLTGRARPNMADAGDFTGPNTAKGYSSFPSGHTAAAFAVATVMANRHPDQKWLYYGLASAVGVARVRSSAHFPSDVLVGAAVGMYAGNRALEGGPRFSLRF